jgi:hypothetical protein
MSEKLTLSKLLPPLSLNGQVAEYQLLRETFVTDRDTQAEVLTQTLVQNLFGMDKAELLSEYQRGKVELQQEDLRRQATTATQVAELDKVITELQRK